MCFVAQTSRSPDHAPHRHYSVLVVFHFNLNFFFILLLFVPLFCLIAQVNKRLFRLADRMGPDFFIFENNNKKSNRWRQIIKLFDIIVFFLLGFYFFECKYLNWEPWCDCSHEKFLFVAFCGVYVDIFCFCFLFFSFLRQSQERGFLKLLIFVVHTSNKLNRLQRIGSYIQI